jgi:hypothetical protein
VISGGRLPEASKKEEFMDKLVKGYFGLIVHNIILLIPVIAPSEALNDLRSSTH